MSFNSFIGPNAIKSFSLGVGEILELYSDDYYNVYYNVNINGDFVVKNIGPLIGQCRVREEDIAYERIVQVSATGSSVFFSQGLKPYVRGIRDFSGQTSNKKTLVISGPYNLEVEDVINSNISFGIPGNSLVSLVFPTADVLMDSGFFDKIGRFYNFKIRNLSGGNDETQGIIITYSTIPVQNSVVNFYGIRRLYPVGLGYPTVADFMIGRIRDLPSGIKNIVVVRKT